MRANGLKTVGDDLQVLTTATSLLDKVGLGADPTDFGLPDLLQTGLTRQEQDARLLDVIENHLFVYKDGRKLPIIVIPPMLEFISRPVLRARAAGHPVEASRRRWLAGGRRSHLADDGI
jgi:hypothetical protein